MRSHSPLKSSKIIGPALRGFMKGEREREGAEICIMHVDMHKHDGGA